MKNCRLAVACLTKEGTLPLPTGEGTYNVPLNNARISFCFFRDAKCGRFLQKIVCHNKRISTRLYRSTPATRSVTKHRRQPVKPIIRIVSADSGGSGSRQGELYRYAGRKKTMRFNQDNKMDRTMKGSRCRDTTLPNRYQPGSGKGCGAQQAYVSCTAGVQKRDQFPCSTDTWSGIMKGTAPEGDT